jgi:hypothetical protein
MNNDGCETILFGLMCFVMGVTVAMLGWLGSTGDGRIYVKNGENYYCSDKGYLDILAEEPFEVRFTCTGENSFETTFGGPTDPELVEEVRTVGNGKKVGLGVVLNDGQLVQLYEGHGYYFDTHWSLEGNN